MKLTAAFGAAVLAAAISVAAAQAPHEQHPGSTASNPYVPRVGDLMILQQIRHAKIWFAVAANNWPLAGHELAGLKDGFDDMNRLYPSIQGISVAPVVGALATGELTELAKAIEAKDRIGFVTAFDRLTAACNACHRNADHGFIVIQQPISPPFNNQSYAPGPGQNPPASAQHPH
jgi:hypothetical protein